jgi:hypothetical protein
MVRSQGLGTVFSSSYIEIQKLRNFNYFAPTLKHYASTSRQFSHIGRQDNQILKSPNLPAGRQVLKFLSRNIHSSNAFIIVACPLGVLARVCS